MSFETFARRVYSHPRIATSPPFPKAEPDADDLTQPYAAAVSNHLRVAAAQAGGLCREDGVAALTDELIGVVVAAVRPVRLNGHGASWEVLLVWEEQIRGWVAQRGPLPGHQPGLFHGHGHRFGR